MKNSNGKKLSFLGALLVAGTVTSAFAAEQTVARGESLVEAASTALTSITTTVDNPTTNYEPNGTCAICMVSTDGESSGNNATVEVYFEDDGEDFEGDFELEVLLDDQTTQNIRIVDAVIAHQETRQYVVAAGSSWSWNQAQSVTFEAINAS